MSASVPSSFPGERTEPCPACGTVLDVTGAQIFAEKTCPVCSTTIHVRRKFGQYELLDRIGGGGQGVVYRAVDNNLNRQVALKLLRTEYSTDPNFLRQFETEAQLTASISHPNVVRVYSFGADEGHVFLAMELIDGSTMDNLMEKVHRVPEVRALEIGIGVAQGLRAGQELGLVHRDVKPGNILFARDGTTKVVDYGLAMFFEQEALNNGEIWGTPYYLSPERLNRVAEDFRSDIYSLGAALFHAIAGRPPFEAETASQVAMKHLHTRAVSLQTFAPNVSNATAYVINRTLAKNPDERQQSYDEFIQQLQYARSEALAAGQSGGLKKTSRIVLEDERSKKAQSWVTLATLGVVLAGAIVGGVMIFKQSKKEETPSPQPSSVSPRDVAGQLLDEAHKKVADDAASPAKPAIAPAPQPVPSVAKPQNLALGAKVEASSVKDGYKKESAVDGNPNTLWAATNNGPKWLSVDLGAPKEISRWVVQTATTDVIANPRFDGWRLLEMSLQKSDNGTNWVTVDTFAQNRSDFVDRVVPKFTARYVRIYSEKLSPIKEDTALRVAELVLGTSADQAKAQYAPTDKVAIRFSTASDFLFGPIGGPSTLGSAEHDAKTGTYTIKGSGHDIWEVKDDFQFVWQPVDGDFEMAARVVSIEAADLYTKAGLMVRNTLDPDSAMAMETCAPNGLHYFERRPDRGVAADADYLKGIAVPGWIKVQRVGAEVTGYHSSDGVTWTKSGSMIFKTPEQTMFVGMAFSSHSPDKAGGAIFDNVKLTKK